MKPRFFLAAGVWMLALLHPAWAQDQAERVHFFIVSDTLDGASKSLGLDLDSKNMVEIIRKGLTDRGLKEFSKDQSQGQFSIDLLEGQAASEQRIFASLRNLKCKPGVDTIVFYYTGHGGFYIDRGHRLNLHNYLNQGGGRVGRYAAEVDRSDLLAAMAKHNPRAIICLTDCCAATGTSDMPEETVRFRETDFSNMPNLPAGKNGDILFDLFFRTKGIVNMTAARTGTLASGERAKGGSFFTIALAKIMKADPKAFDKNQNQFAEWEEVFPALQKITEKESWRPMLDRGGKAITDAGVRVGTCHSPEFFMLGKPARTEKGVVEKDWRREPPLPVVEDELKASDKVISLRKDHRAYSKEYPIQLVAKHPYIFALHSAHFDCFLYLKDATGKIIASDDDYGGTTRSRLAFTAPVAGTYTVGVTSFVSEETGKFTLSSHKASYFGTLTPEDPEDRYRKKSYVHVYPVHLKSGRSYTFTLESMDNNLDAFLRVEDRFGNTLALNDDEDKSTRFNSIISFRPNFSETYFLIATTMIPRQTGPYALFVHD